MPQPRTIPVTDVERKAGFDAPPALPTRPSPITPPVAPSPIAPKPVPEPDPSPGNAAVPVLRPIVPAPIAPPAPVTIVEGSPTREDKPSAYEVVHAGVGGYLKGQRLPAERFGRLEAERLISLGAIVPVYQTRETSGSE